MRIALTFLLAVAVFTWAEEGRSQIKRFSPPVQPDPSATRLVAYSDDFIVRSFQGGPAAADLLDSIQQLRDELRAIWCGKDSGGPWRPRCEIVVHRSRAAYQQAVGGGGQTYGSSLVRFDKHRVVTRRIDLLPGTNGEVTALAHELMHVVLADRFAGHQPPRWADEGIALLADFAEKRRLHQRDCQYALHSGTALPLRELFHLDRYSPDTIGAFYGQSLSLAEFLIERDTPATFLAFVELAMDTGYDHALQRTYAINGIEHLEAEWRAYATSPSKSPNTVRFATLRSASE